MCAPVVEVVEEGALLLCSQHQIDTGELGVPLRLELCRAAGDDDHRIGMIAVGAPDQLPALPVRHRGDGAGIDQHQVGRLALPGEDHAPL